MGAEPDDGRDTEPLATEFVEDLGCRLDTTTAPMALDEVPRNLRTRGPSRSLLDWHAGEATALFPS